MRFIKEIPNDKVKTSLYVWNNKFILKFEAGDFEQIFKFSELDYSQIEIEEMISTTFINKVVDRFYDMQKDLT